MALKNRLFILFFCLLIFETYSQTSRLTDRGTLIGWSARTVGIKRANNASFSQASDVLNNPAILSEAESDQYIAYTHNNSLGGLSKLDHLLLIFSGDSSKFNLGFSGYRFTNADIFETSAIYSNGAVDFTSLGSLKNNDYGLKLLLSKPIFKNKSNVGVELNVDFLSVGEFTKSAVVGLDFGYNLVVNEKINYGLSIDNILGKYYLWSQNSDLLEQSYFASGNYIKLKSTYIQLPYIQNGFDYKLLTDKNIVLKAFFLANIGFGRVNNFLTESNWLNFSGSLGMEFKLLDQFYVRGGVSEIENVWTGNENKIYFAPSLGLGYEKKGVSLDYSWGDFYLKTIPLQKHVITVSLQLNSEKKNTNNINTGPSRL